MKKIIINLLFSQHIPIYIDSFDDVGGDDLIKSENIQYGGGLVKLSLIRNFN